MIQVSHFLITINYDQIIITIVIIVSAVAAVSVVFTVACAVVIYYFFFYIWSQNDLPHGFGMDYVFRNCVEVCNYCLN